MDKLKSVNVESIAKAAVKNAKEIVKTSAPIVSNFVRTSFDWLLETNSQLPLTSTAKSYMQNSSLSFKTSVGFVIFILFRLCCGGGGNGKTMKAPGRKNVRIPRRNFESSPKYYFRDLHAFMATSSNSLHMANWTSKCKCTSPRSSQMWSRQAPNHRYTNIASSLLSLGRRIVRGETRWRETVVYEGEYCHISRYLE
ncbi:hypothetical protein RND71_023585 [Anisodus tanguticus]|uniref:Uncharacterized protein n=1 Tax=Anisodus tanguticus TaxID=243964 RepID=A0AAE1RUN4_9SOLA|nr:hypothetical protein RND71_023585 [Anisodus tanguticus]